MDVPDLDIPARAPKAAAKPAPSAGTGAAAAPAAAARRPAAPAVPTDLGLRNLGDDDDLAAGGLDLDLDLGNGPPLVRGENSASLPKIPKAAEAKGGEGPGADRAPPKEAAAPAAPTAPSQPLAAPARAGVDPIEARALSAYGDAPKEIWRTPLYAYRVLRRRPTLKKLVLQKKREADRATGAEEDAMVAFAESIRSKAETLPLYGRVLDEVRGTERVLGERDAVLAAETDAHRHKQAEADAHIAALEGELSQIQMEERAIAGELNEAETLLKRADAHVKRVEIEIRNALAQAEGEPGSADAKGVGP
jgi:hypothetical protein